MSDAIARHLARFPAGTIVTVVRRDGTREVVQAQPDGPRSVDGVSPQPPPVVRRVRVHGPGTILTAILRRLGLRAATGCKCHARAREMNIRGCDWCEKNSETIVGWLALEAGRAGLPFNAMGARILVGLAIKIARRRQRR